MEMKRTFVVSAIAASAAFATPTDAHNANCLDYLTAEVAFEEEVAIHRQAKEAANNAMRRPERVYQNAKRAAEMAFKRAKSAAHRRRKRTEQVAGSVAGKAISGARNAFSATRRKAHRKTRDIENGRKARRAFRKARREAEAVRNQAIKKAKAARSKAFHAAKVAYREDVKTAEAARDITIKNVRIARDRTAYPARLSYQRATKAYRAAYEKARGTLGDAYIRAYANPYGFRRKVSGYTREVVLKAAFHERVNQCPEMLKKQPEPR